MSVHSTMPTTPIAKLVFAVGDIGDSGRQIDLEVSAAEREGIRDRLGIVSVDDLHIAGQLFQAGKGTLYFRGTVSGCVQQECRISLEPVPEEVAEEVDILFMPDPGDSPRELELDPEEQDVEYYEGGIGNLGDVLVQYLALGLDPYPRAPAVEMPAEARDESDEEIEAERQESSPFAVLKNLKDKT